MGRTEAITRYKARKKGDKAEAVKSRKHNMNSDDQVRVPDSLLSAASLLCA
jgi:hypothetical protein